LTNPINRKKIILIFLLTLLVAGSIFALPLFLHQGQNSLGEEGEVAEQPTPSPEPELPVSLEIVCVGDIMVHEPQIPSQFDSATGTYDYTNNFQYIKPYIEKADLALGNFEGTFGGAPYKGYPAFSAPDGLASALKGAGFDVIVTANNHMTDRGHEGVLRTLDVLEEQKLVIAGSRRDPADPRYALTTVEGITIGVVAYTYETSGSGPEVFINGSFIPERTAALLNSFSYNRLDGDMSKIGEIMTAARDAGAELVILYLHWGEEYQQTPNQWQRTIAEKAAAELGADIIFASHPHVLQEMTLIPGKNPEQMVPVFYSMGNFISNQRQETLQNRFTEQGMIARVNLEFMKSTGTITSLGIEATPTWVDRYKRNGKTVYEIIPLDDQMETNPALMESGHLERARQAREDIHGLLGITE
jgi:poly-gamma-glutamate synthesis protein (capsule biosynthesis protein)